MACNGLGLCGIFYQSVPAEDTNDHIKGALKPLRISQYHHGIVGVKKSQTPPYRNYQSLMGNQLVLHCQRKKVTYHIIHYQVEVGGQDESALSSSPIFFGVWAVVPFLSGDNLLLAPK